MDLSNIIHKIRNNQDTSIKGYHDLILQIGLNNEILEQQPKELSEYFGKGLKMWQYPSQLSTFANYISNLTVSSYLEIGCRYGGTFIFVSEVLRKNNENIELHACDLIPMSEILLNYMQIQKFTYTQDSSENLVFSDKTPEFVFIDGDHRYDFVKSDFNLFADKEETKYIVFHDIDNDNCTDVSRFWKEMQNDSRFNTIEFCDQYESVDGHFLGIGLAIRK